jgi:hypothetical protein
MKGKDMKNRSKRKNNEMRPEYDFDYSKGIRGKYYKRLTREGANVIVLEPDIAKAFHDSAMVNDVLRSFLKLTRLTKIRSSHSSKNTTKAKVNC